ncbi:universal stress protein [Novosphingobium malaysiense]|uniref:Universal stress protein UspA n=1 Tax=Novosphingobium malaysiense TaxID=1348853 RepID=A0A0B1ZU00_9SPHN|nr:universal stress protein [Novosphingobium malaysiense]KHK92603.1 universal stress protein UspA [Novosphingobium malaysiense]
MPEKHHPILVATDLSARSDRAVDRAVFMASQRDARLIVLHATERGSRLDEHQELAEKTIRAVLPDPSADIEIVSSAGSAPKLIVEAAKSAECSLIVTGVARFNTMGDFFTGTAVDHIVRHADAPVLVVKQRCHDRYRSMLVATDYSSCSRAALVTAAEMFPDATIQLVHAYHVPYEGWLRDEANRQAATQEAEKDLKAFLADPAIPQTVRTRTRLRIGYGGTTRVVAEMALEDEVDLVVIGTHGRGGLIHATIGSMAESLLESVQPDTLMVRERA